MASQILRTALTSAVSQTTPTRNYEYQTRYGLRTVTGQAVFMYAYFTRPFPLGATIQTAKLVLYSDAIPDTGTTTVTATRLKQQVSMTGVTYNTRPTSLFPSPAVASNTGAKPAGYAWEIDVTAHMQSVANGDPWYGWQVVGSFPASRMFYSHRWLTTTQRPRLEVTYSIPPTAPSDPVPAGGRAVSLAKPVLRATYTDLGADNPIQAIQVQRNTANVWGVPTWDSGQVTASAAELDTATTTWPALADNETVWWRMRVLDINGLWSAWSIPESFRRDIKGSVTITNPAVAPNNQVNEATPPITWTFAGETQAAYQVNIADPATGRVIWSSGKITGTATGLTLPEGVLTETGVAYNLRVIIWDAKQRETTPADPAWTDASRDFTFALSATAAPTLGLTAVPTAGRPRIVLTWTRSTAPDSFTVLRNGAVVESGILPQDVLVSGTTYSWTDPQPVPIVSSTYQVAAVVNGKASSGNATATLALTVQGIWLADKTRTNEVLIYGKSDRNWIYGETSEVFEVLGATEVSVVTHSLRGLEGSVTGQLRGGGFIPGLPETAQGWRDALLRIKRKPGQQCWLTVADMCLPVVVRNVHVTPRPTTPLSFDVSFDFYQVSSK